MSVKKKTSRVFSQYEPLRKALTRAGIERPGIVANYLLKSFVRNGGRLRAHCAVADKVCKENAFRAWREMMREKGWITYVLNSSNKWMDYYPTDKLAKYINKEKSNEEMATRFELDSEISNLREESREDFGKLKSKIHKLESTVDQMNHQIKWLLEQIDPPDTPEKRLKYIKGGYQKDLSEILSK